MAIYPDYRRSFLKYYNDLLTWKAEDTDREIVFNLAMDLALTTIEKQEMKHLYTNMFEYARQVARKAMASANL